MGRRGWGPGAWRWRLTALLGVAVAALAVILAVPGTLADPGGKGHRTPSAPPLPGRPGVGWGLTHTEHSADEGAPAARERAEKLLGSRPMPQNEAIMGWGAGNPEPAPGRYDFAAMDSRMELIRRSGGTPVITLCCAPDWMKGGRPGARNTDWSQENLEKAPLPAHYQDFADLAAAVAGHYPSVRHFLVWNEFKGFWDERRGRWDYEGYTRLYNLVYRALKKVDKDIQVGGPYLGMDSVGPGHGNGGSPDAAEGAWGRLDQRVVDAFDYWNEHKAGADFVVVDGTSYPRGDVPLPDAFAATDKFTDVSAWLRRRTGGLPLWWAEYYVEPADARGARTRWGEQHRVAVQAAGLMALAKGGVTSGFYWNPETRTGSSCAGCLWRPTGRASGGGALPMYGLVSRFHEEFGPGTRFRRVTVAGADASHVRVLADDRAVLVVNTLDRPVGAEVDGRRLAMRGYEVTWLRR
ncbi:xylan 1,4-beta-xylosidase [Streptomyces sp. NPDC046939]|uniref:xylan 1,4-beta-xylosidase n=1 Tax=Streptomyces sp. NPDC046939 TaxID=3155376 RepID=UPI00340E8CBF